MYNGHMYIFFFFLHIIYVFIWIEPHKMLSLFSDMLRSSDKNFTVALICLLYFTGRPAQSSLRHIECCGNHTFHATYSLPAHSSFIDLHLFSFPAKDSFSKYEMNCSISANDGSLIFTCNLLDAYLFPLCHLLILFYLIVLRRLILFLLRCTQ